MARNGKTLALNTAVNDLDLTFVQEVSQGVLDFLKRSVAFFRKADELEQTAKALKQEALQLRPGAELDQAGDVKVQELIKTCSAQVKVIEDHWEITGIVYRFHKRLVERRDRGVTLLKESIKLGNATHNAYTDEAKRLAEIERRRLQAIEDQKARDRRQQELDDLETEKSRLEAQSATLSDREAIFVTRYLLWGNATRAAREAGYQAPESRAALLLQSKKILGEIERRKSVLALAQQKQAVEDTPVQATQVEVKANIGRASGAKERTTYKGVILDRDEFFAAALRGEIPIDCLTINDVRFNQYARDTPDVVNSWGKFCQAVKNTGII